MQPPQRLTVDEWADEHRFVNQPGAYVGPWKNETTEYMREPMTVLTSRSFTGLVFVGSAQTGKTDALLVNNIGYTVTVDPMDMLIVNPSSFLARDFSVRRLDRLARDTKIVGKALMKKRDSDNKYDKQYTNGTLVSLAWPSATQSSGRPTGRVALTDYDRMPDDIDGEGSAFDLFSKRTTTFGSFAMTVAESTPSREIDPEKVKNILEGHEAPPVTGIFELYNRGDRRRWHWPCPDCGSYFEGRFKHLKWEECESNLDSAETVYMECPHCETHIEFDSRKGMNEWGVWLKEGQSIVDNRVVGEGRRSAIASFWVSGVAAAFQTWQRLVQKYLDAEEAYNKNGDEEALKTFYNTDLGEIYIPKSYLANEERTPEMLQARAYDFPFVDGGEEGEDAQIHRVTNEEAGYPKKLTPKIPAEVRGLIGLVDVQKNLYVVQVFGISPGVPYDLKFIDRYQIRKSERIDDDGDPYWVKPGSHQQDWDLIEDAVIRKTYPVDDDSGRRMSLHYTFCDSGGKAGVTTNAYNFVRKLRKHGLGNRFHLVKGQGRPNTPRVKIIHPDSSRSGSKAGARGDIPVLEINSNMVKNTLDNMLDVVLPGEGMVHFASWLPDWVYEEMTAERRGEKGWEPKGKQPNEAFDLSYYAVAACISTILNVEKMDWENPHDWLKEWDDNPTVKEEFKDDSFEQRRTYNFGKLGKQLG